MKLDILPLEARPELVETLAEWFRDLRPGEFDERDAVAHFEKQAQTEELPIALVVLADDELAGTVALKKTSSGPFDEPEPWVGDLFVHPNYRGRGIAHLLVNSASRIAWAMDYDAVYTATEEVDLFEAMGWTVVDDSQEITLLRYERPPAPPSYYEQIGGEEVVRALVDRFYDLMDQKPEAHDIRAMHAKSLRSSRQKLFEFLSGWLGGPNLYVEKRGHPRLRMRHMPFEIGTDARDQWLMCMDQALEETVENEEVRQQISDSFARIADHMRNRRGP